MKRFLVKVNFKNKVIDYASIPKRMSATKLNLKRRELFKGYKLVKANNYKSAINRVLMKKKLRM
jgi:hypothetical protein